MPRFGSLVGFCYQPDVIVTSRSVAQLFRAAEFGRAEFLERLLEPLLEVCAVSATHDQFGAILQEHRVVAMAARLELCDPVGVDRRGPVHAYEPLAIEALEQMCHA